MRILSYRTAALIAALLILPGAARAQWLKEGSVTTSPITSANDSATVNYAVFEQTKTGTTVGVGTLATYLSTNTALKNALIASVGTAGLTTLENSKYAYFYQVAPTSAITSSIKSFFVGNPGATTIAASANGFVFQQNTHAVTIGPLVNQPGGTSTLAGSMNANLTFVSNSGAKSTTPDGTSAFGDTGDPATQFSLSSSTNGIGKNQYSSLMVLGSNYGPGSGEVETSDGGAATAFGVPVPSPEPGTFALLALALPILGLRYGRRLQNRLKGAATLAA